MYSVFFLLLFGCESRYRIKVNSFACHQSVLSEMFAIVGMAHCRSELNSCLSGYGFVLHLAWHRPFWFIEHFELVDDDDDDGSGSSGNDERLFHLQNHLKNITKFDLHLRNVHKSIRGYTNKRVPSNDAKIFETCSEIFSRMQSANEITKTRCAKPGRESEKFANQKSKQV